MPRSERTFRLLLVSLCEGPNVWGSGDTTFSNLSTNTISFFCCSLLRSQRAMLGGTEAYHQLGNRNGVPICRTAE
jgi:hypothetical protein